MGVPGTPFKGREMDAEISIDRIIAMRDALGDAMYHEAWGDIASKCEELIELCESVSNENVYSVSERDNPDQLFAKFLANLDMFSFSDAVEALCLLKDKARVRSEYEKGGEYRAQVESEWEITQAREYEAEQVASAQFDQIMGLT